MLREKLIAHYERAGKTKKFRNREVSRLEGLSDTVFGFAITLLIVSLEVPRTSTELIETMRGFIAFAFTFFVLFTIWFRQFNFFRRYGLEDTVTIMLNGALLFVVLFFIYPLKFLATWIVGRLMGGSKMVQVAGGGMEAIVKHEHMPWLFAIYGLGFAAVFGVFALLYGHAQTKSDELGLTELELWETRHSVKLFSLISLLGVLVAIAGSETVLESKGTAGEIVSYAISAAEILGIVTLFRVRFKGSRERKALESAAARDALDAGPALAN